MCMLLLDGKDIRGEEKLSESALSLDGLRTSTGGWILEGRNIEASFGSGCLQVQVRQVHFLAVAKVWGWTWVLGWTSGDWEPDLRGEESTEFTLLLVFEVSGAIQVFFSLSIY